MATETNQMTQMLKVGQVADRLRIGEDGVYALIRSGHLIASDVSRPGSKKARWRVSETDLQLYLRQQEFKKPAPRRRRNTSAPSTPNYFDEYGRPTR